MHTIACMRFYYSWKVTRRKDYVVLPDGKRVKITYGSDRLARNIDTAYPEQRDGGSVV